MRLLIRCFGIIGILGLTACQENIDVFVPFDSSLISLLDGDIDRLFYDLNPTSSSFEWEAEESKLLQLPSGVNISIPNYAFTNAEGETVSGPIQVNLVEMLSAGQMIIQDKPIVSSGNILEAAGNFMIEAEQDGAPLQLGLDQLILFQLPVNQLPGAANTSMRLYFGDNQNPQFFNWEQGTSDIQVIELLDSSTMELYQAYQFATDRLGWLGCNAPIEENQQWTTICVDLPNGFNSDNTAVFLAFQNFKGVAKLFEIEGSETASFCKDQIPTSSDAMVIVLAEAGNDSYFFGSSMIHVSGPEMNLAIQPQKVDLEVINTFLNEL